MSYIRSLLSVLSLVVTTAAAQGQQYPDPNGDRVVDVDDLTVVVGNDKITDGLGADEGLSIMLQR